MSAMTWGWHYQPQLPTFKSWPPEPNLMQLTETREESTSTTWLSTLTASFFSFVQGINNVLLMNRNDSHYFSVLECVSVSLFTRPYREHHVQRQWELSIIRTKRALKDLVLSPTGATSPILLSQFPGIGCRLETPVFCLALIQPLSF